MNEPHAENHWKDLASILGAAPTAEVEPPPPAACLPPTTKPPAQKRPKPAATTAKAADWNSIALNLGIEPPPQPIEPQPTSVQPIPPRAMETSTPPQSQYTSVKPESGDESPNFFDEKFDFEEPFDLLESAEGKPASAADKDAAQEREAEPEQAAQKSRKRRRRRRPRQRTDGDSDQPRSVEVEALPASAKSAEPERADFPYDDESLESADRRRAKRRRPRHDKHRRDDRQAESEPTRHTADKEDFDDDEHFHDEFADDEALAEGERPPRAGFRGIPTWDEAVGMLVEKNLAARSKRQAEAPRRGQDNRGQQGRPPRHDKRRG